MAILKEVVLVSSDQQEKKMLKDCLSDPQLRKLADAMDEDVVHAGDAILREGEIGDTFYVIADGRVQVETKHDGIVTTLEKGGYFGDRALISEDRRAATCTAIGGDVKLRAGKGCENPNFKGSYLGRFPLVLADFWTSDHLSERSRP